MNSVLIASGLCKSYGAFALNGVVFDVPRGYIMGFVGPNGAGKTTTIKLILDVITAEAGTVKKPSNEKIGVVMDAPLYVGDWTVADVEASLAPFYQSWSNKAFAEHTRKFGLDANKKIKELSRGMKVKLQIAVALSHDAELLVLDEPTSGLDPVARDEICDLLRVFVLDERKSVLFSTHITTDLEKTADYITFILNGNIVYTGAKDTLLVKYARVTGGLSELSTEQKNLIIGYREHNTGFEGMVEAVNVGKLSRTTLMEAITLDEIVIYMNKGTNINE
jgi:ABC-2 type transport system ATP-binding protein